MIIADLPYKKRKVYWMVEQYARANNLDFKEAVKELVEISKQLTERTHNHRDT